MDIIENNGAQVIRLEIEKPSYWWESSKLPTHVTCHIQEMTQEGAVNLCLSFSTLSKIMERALAERNKMQDQWLNPTTDCCNTKMPREHTIQNYHGDNFYISCKQGYGCRRDLREEFLKHLRKEVEA